VVCALVGRLAKLLAGSNPAIPENDAREEALRKAVAPGHPVAGQDQNSAFHACCVRAVPVEYPRPDGRAIAGDHVRLFELRRTPVPTTGSVVKPVQRSATGNTTAGPTWSCLQRPAPGPAFELKNAAVEARHHLERLRQLQDLPKAEIPSLLFSTTPHLVVSDGLQGPHRLITPTGVVSSCGAALDGETDAPATALQLWKR